MKLQEDFYVWKNPKITDKQVHDAMEKRVRGLVDQLRVMEKVILEKEQEIEFLYGQYNQLHSSISSDGSATPLARSVGSSGYSSPSSTGSSPNNTKINPPIR